MATPNIGILTTAGKALIAKVNSGQAKISFSKVVFSSMDNSQLSDTQVKALTAISPQEVVVSPPETTLDTASGETRIRATGTNKQLADGVYVKTYGVFAKDDTGNEILYGVTVSPNPNYFPAYDGVTPQAVTYSYKTVIQETSNITMTNSNDVYVTQEDLTEAIEKIPQPDLSSYVTQQQLAAKANDATSFHRDATGTVTESGNFPALQVKGDNVATAAELKSLEASAWRVLTGSSEFLNPFTFLYRLHDDQKYMEAVIGGTVIDSNSVGGRTVVDLAQIINEITSLSGKIVNDVISNGNSELAFSGAKIITPANKAFTKGAICSTLGTNPDIFFKIGYSELV